VNFGDSVPRAPRLLMFTLAPRRMIMVEMPPKPRLIFTLGRPRRSFSFASLTTRKPLDQCQLIDGNSATHYCIRAAREVFTGNSTMRHLRLALVLVLFCFSQVVHSYTIGTTNTYINLAWNLSGVGSPFSGCNELILDGVGDLTHGNKVTIYGVMNCPSQSGGYGVSGVAYLGIDGTFNMTVNIGSIATIACPRLIGLNGACTIYLSSGTTLGTASLFFK
jgi:hypothetical protein